MDLEFEPDWGELAPTELTREDISNSNSQNNSNNNIKPKPFRRKPKKHSDNKLEEHNITARSVLDEDEFFRAAQAFVQATDRDGLASVSKNDSVNIKLPLPATASLLSPHRSVPLLPPPPRSAVPLLLPPPSKHSTSWAVLGGPVADISVLEDRLLALQENRLHPNVEKKPARRVPKERDKGVDLCFAAHSGDVETAEQLLENGADPNFLDFSRRSPLHLAASSGCMPIVSLLLQFGASLTLTGGTSQLTALHFAAEAGHGEVVQLLCARGADVEALSFAAGEFAPIATGLSPLCIACERGHYEVVVALCDAKADIYSCFGSQSRTPLFFAASNNQLSTPAIVSHLVALGADCDIRSSSNATAAVGQSNRPDTSLFSVSADAEALRPLRSPNEEDNEQPGGASESESDKEFSLLQRFDDQTLEADSDGENEFGLDFSSMWEHPSTEIRSALHTGLIELRKNLNNVFDSDLESPVRFLFPMALTHILDYLCLAGNTQHFEEEVEELDPLQNDSYESLWE